MPLFYLLLKLPKLVIKRLLTALKEEITPLEMVILIRHFLRREDEKMQGGTPQTLKVPSGHPYPQDRKLWEQCGIKIIRETSDYFLISADPWDSFMVKILSTTRKRRIC